MKIEDCTTEICRTMIEHAERQELLAWLFGIMGVLAIAAIWLRE